MPSSGSICVAAANASFTGGGLIFKRAVPVAPPRPATTIRKVSGDTVPNSTEHDDEPPIRLSDERLEPTNTPSTASKSLSQRSMVTVVFAGAVHWYQTLAPTPGNAAA